MVSRELKSLCDRRVILQLNYDGWVWQESEGRDGLGQGSRLGEMGKVWTRSETITEDQRRESVGENLSLLPACYGQCTSQKSLPVIRRGGSVGGMWRRFCAGVLDMTTSRYPWVKLQKTLWRLARDFDYFNRRVGSGDMVSTTYMYGTNEPDASRSLQRLLLIIVSTDQSVELTDDIFETKKRS